VLAVRNCCYVAVCSAAEGASAPTGEERGGGIPWRPPAYSFFNFVCSIYGRGNDVLSFVTAMFVQ